MFWVVLVLLALGAVTGAIAADKGLRFATWFVIGFALGPIGIFWAGVTPPAVEWEAKRRRAIEQAMEKP